MDPITTSLLVSGATGLVNAILSGGKGDQQQAIEKYLNMLENEKDNLGGLAMSRGEVMNLVSDIQELYRGGADVAAGRVGSAIGESGVAGGQGFADLHLQSTAPIIAEGEFKSADAEKWGAQFFAQLDESRKRNLTNFYSLLLNGSSQLPGTNTAQRTALGFLQGAKFGGDAFESFYTADYLANKDKPIGNKHIPGGKK